MRSFLLALSLGLLLLPARADFQILNKPGQMVDVSTRLVKGKQNLVVFHSNSQPISRRVIGEYKALGDRRADLAVLVVDINQLGSPVARHYRVTSVPAVQIYDAEGKLTMEGTPAYNESMKWVTSGR